MENLTTETKKLTQEEIEGYYKDKNRKIMSPIIRFKRDSLKITIGLEITRSL
jgi:hypothetical protein